MAVKAIAYLEKVLAGCCEGPGTGLRGPAGRKRKLEESNNNLLGPRDEAKTAGALLKLGHLHLLMEDYGKALSAYQKYRALCPEAKKQVRTDISRMKCEGLELFRNASTLWVRDLSRIPKYCPFQRKCLQI